MSLINKKYVFISYSRTDGAESARRVCDLLKQNNIEFWQDIHDVSGTLDNWPEVKKAIDLARHLVLILTDCALESKWVKREWQYANEEGIIVSPILVTNRAKSDLKYWQRRGALYEMENIADQTRLIKVLEKDGSRNKVCYDVVELPERFVQREDIFTKIKSELIDQNGDPIPKTIALTGAGGYGKTVLANALCWDKDLRFAFSDGIIRVDLKEIDINSKDDSILIGLIGDIVYKLSGTRPDYSNLNHVADHLARVIGNSYLLLIIDDVRRGKDVRPFLRLNKNCARIITTRLRENDDFPQKTIPFDVDQLSELDKLAAYEIISDGLHVETLVDRHLLEGLSQMLGYCAQMLSLANRRIWSLISEGKHITIPIAVDSFKKKLLDKGFKSFDPYNEVERDRSMYACIDASFESFSSEQKARFFELTVFSECGNIPIDIISLLWSKTGKLDYNDTVDLCRGFYKHSLFQEYSSGNAEVKIHDNILCFIREGFNLEKYKKIHKILIDVLVDKFNMKWSEIPPENKYVWKHLITHFRKAGYNQEANKLLLDYKWIQNKLLITSGVDLYSEYLLESGDSFVDTVGQAIALSLPNLAKDKSDISAQLWGRLGYFKNGFDGFFANVCSDNSSKKLYCLYPSLTPPGLERIRLIGHQSSVLFAKFYFHGSEAKVFTASTDANAMIWSSDTGALIDVIATHDSEITSLSFSLDYSLCLTASDDLTAKLWNLFTRKHIYTFYEHANKINGALFSNDGTKIVTASSDSIARIWDVLSGKLIKELEGHRYSVNSAVFSPDSKMIITASDDSTACIWDGNLNWSISQILEHTGPVKYAIYSLDGKKVITVLDDGNLYIWIFQDLLTPQIIKAHELSINYVEMSSDGTMFATASDDHTACIWDFASGALIKRLTGHEYAVNSVVFSPDGKRVLTASNDNTARLWDFIDGDSFVILKGHEGKILRAEFSENGSQVVTASADSTARIWYSKGVDEPNMYKDFHSKKINDIVFSPDGRFVLSSSDDKTAKIWDVNTGCLLNSINGHNYAINKSAFSFDGQKIITVSDDSTAQLFDTHNTEKRLLLIEHNGGVKFAMFSPDSDKVITVSEDNTAKVSDVKSGAEIRSFVGHGSFISAAMFSNDGMSVVTSSGDCTAAVWRYHDSDEVLYLEGHERWLSCASFSHDDKTILTASGDGTSRIWFTKTGEELLRFDCTAGFSHSRNVLVMKALFSVDNKHVLTVSKSFFDDESYSDNYKPFWSARVWDAISCNVVSALDDMPGILQCAEFAIDNSVVVSILGDKTLRVFDIASKSEIACMRFDAGLNALSVKNDLIAVGDNLGRLHLCKLVL